MLVVCWEYEFVVGGVGGSKVGGLGGLASPSA